MKPILTAILLLSCCVLLNAQSKDEAYYNRVDKRVEVMMDHFTTQVSTDSAVVDTVAYVQLVFANHLETIKLRTNEEKNRRPMYAYAIKLRDKKLAEVLSKEVLVKYFESFKSESSGFPFCPVCSTSRPKNQKFCACCGTGY